MIRELFEDMPLISSIAVLFLIVFLFFSLDASLPDREFHKGTVIDKHYKAETNRTGTGYGLTGSGQTGVIITSETEPEKFLLMVKAHNGKVVTAKCSPELYYEKEIGQEIEYAIYKGWFTGFSWSIQCYK